MRAGRKRDVTEPAILRVLRQVGADYLLLDPFDVLVLYRHRLFMMDCKVPSGRVTATQAGLVTRGWPLRFVVTPDDALAVLGIGGR